jgi:ATP-binding cassette subfamily B protein
LRRISRDIQDGLAHASEVAGEAIGGVKTVRAFDALDLETDRYRERLHEAFKLARRRAWLGATFQGGMSLASYAAIAAVVWYGGRLALEGDLSLGDLTAFLLYTFTLAFSIGTLNGLWEDFSKALGSTDVVFELFERPEVIPSGSHRPSTCLGEVYFNEVSFSYPSRDEVLVLDRLSLRLAPQKTLALVGQSGGGKSTVASLLQRMYDPDEGDVTLDELSLRDLDTHWLRSQIAVVSQEPQLFAATIEDNLRYGRPQATQDELVSAAIAAQAHDFISTLPEGYQTLIGERGVRLSGGQRQRIAIARALLRDPKILILDEATSALDAESEEAVQHALKELMAGRTTLMIAHRLSTVRDADEIVVIEEGRVIESGQHDQLIARGGRYAQLVRAQLSGA